MKQKVLLSRTAEEEWLNHAVEEHQSPEISTVCALLNDSALYDCCIGNHTGTAYQITIISGPTFVTSANTMLGTRHG